MSRICSNVSGVRVSNSKPTRFNSRSSGSIRSSPAIVRHHSGAVWTDRYCIIRLRRAIVDRRSGDARPGAHELEVDVDGERAIAIAYPDLCGPVTVGDVVILNTTAVSLGLGTGGVHFVVAVEGAHAGDDAASGRVMKARYTPSQTAVSSVEETHRELIEGSNGLEQTPVVCAPLHSMLGPIAAGAKRAGDARVVYVMTDGAALPVNPLVGVRAQVRGAGRRGGITCGDSVRVVSSRP